MAGEHLAEAATPADLQRLVKGGLAAGRRESRVVMAGRSNVGKSTLINALCGQTVARVSARPGKTRGAHFYHWPDARLVLVDLPGYGFARAAKAEKEKWAQLVRAYFGADRGIALALLVTDARHGPTDSDLEAAEFLGSMSIPLAFVASKADQVKGQSERAARLRDLPRDLARAGFENHALHWVSAESGQGIEGLRRFLAAIGEGGTG